MAILFSNQIFMYYIYEGLQYVYLLVVLEGTKNPQYSIYH